MSQGNTRPELPFHNGVSAWWAALRAYEPRMSYAYAMGMLGGVARIAFCSNTCLCREWREVGVALPAGLETLGYRTTQVTFDRPERAVATIRRSLGRGLPLPCFDDESEGIVTGIDEQSGVFLRSFVHKIDRQNARDLTFDELSRMRVFTISRSRAPRGPRRAREIAALLSWVAYAHRPPLAGTHGQLRTLPTEGVGITAYELWAGRLEDYSGTIAAEMEVRAQWWLDARRAAAAFALELAGTQRSAFAVRLRRAAALFQREIAECLEPLAGLVARRIGMRDRGRTGRAAADLLRRASEIEATAIKRVAEAAFVGSDFDRRLGAALMDAPNAPLDGRMLQEVIYLARAGARPLRLMAARRLVGSPTPPSISTLNQLLHDPDGPVSETALWALRQLPLHNPSRMFAAALRSVERSNPNTDQPLQRALLFALAEEADETARQALAEALKDSNGAYADAIRETAAGLLFERFPDHSISEFESALQSDDLTIRGLARRYVRRIRRPA